MSGLETVKIIVDAEKEAASQLVQAEAKALEIKKQVDGLIVKEREEKLRSLIRAAILRIQNLRQVAKEARIL